jgi:hypothetical protein
MLASCMHVHRPLSQKAPPNVPVRPEGEQRVPCCSAIPVPSGAVLRDPDWFRCEQAQDRRDSRLKKLRSTDSSRASRVSQLTSVASPHVSDSARRAPPALCFTPTPVARGRKCARSLLTEALYSLAPNRRESLALSTYILMSNVMSRRTPRHTLHATRHSLSLNPSTQHVTHVPLHITCHRNDGATSRDVTVTDERSRGRRER